jgi:hypothetical protein
MPNWKYTVEKKTVIKDLRWGFIWTALVLGMLVWSLYDHRALGWDLFWGIALAVNVWDDAVNYRKANPKQ